MKLFGGIWLIDGNGDRIFSVVPKENTGNWHDDGNNGQWQSYSSNKTYDDGSWNPQKYVYPLTKEQAAEIKATDRTTTTKTSVSYDKDLIDNTIFIPNGINQWNKERYELTGYINNVNTEHTQVLMEYGTSGKIGAVYEYGVSRESMSVGSKVNYYAYDGRGNVSELMNAIGGVNMSYSYGAFGKTSTKVTTYTRNSYTYNGENVDLIPGVPDLQYLRARYYDPNMGRFMQQDTLFGEMERPLTQNLYVYCLNNGVNLRDPSGNSAIDDAIASKNKYIGSLSNQLNQAQSALSNATNQPQRDAIKKKIDDLNSQLSQARREMDNLMAQKGTLADQDPPKNPQAGGGSGSGNSGNNGNNLTPSGGGNSSGGGGNYPTGTGNPNTGGNDKPELTEWEKRLYELYKNGQLGLMEREYFQNNILPKINVWPDNGVPVLDGKPRNDYPNYVEGGIHGATDFPAGIGQTFTLLLLVKLLDLLMVILILLIC